MPSPIQRIAVLEKELEKYNIKRTGMKTFSSIKEDITKRIKILNLVHAELMSISTELFYYNMIDHLGNTKLESLTIRQCITLYKELNSAMIKFEMDQDKKYMTQCEKLKRRILWAGSNITRDFLEKKNEECYEFIKELPEENKEKLRKYYFNLRKKELGKIIKECNENIEKSYELLITGEIISYNRFFKDKNFNENTNEIVPKSLENYLIEILGSILNKKNKTIAKDIVRKLNKLSKQRLTEADKIFRKAVKQIYGEIPKNSVEI